MTLRSDLAFSFNKMINDRFLVLDTSVFLLKCKKRPKTATTSFWEGDLLPFVCNWNNSGSLSCFCRAWNPFLSEKLWSRLEGVRRTQEISSEFNSITHKKGILLNEIQTEKTAGLYKSRVPSWSSFSFLFIFISTTGTIQSTPLSTFLFRFLFNQRMPCCLFNFHM